MTHHPLDEVRSALEELREIYAGMDGFIPETCPEGYQQKIIKDLYDCGMNALSLLSDYRAKEGWQPIETAPSDTVVLLYSPDRGVANEARIECREYRNTKGGSRHAWATHWMPLPPPPALISEDKGV